MLIILTWSCYTQSRMSYWREGERENLHYIITDTKYILELWRKHQNSERLPNHTYTHKRFFQPVPLFSYQLKKILHFLTQNKPPCLHDAYPLPDWESTTFSSSIIILAHHFISKLYFTSDAFLFQPETQCIHKLMFNSICTLCLWKSPRKGSIKKLIFLKGQNLICKGMQVKLSTQFTL